MSRDYAWRYEVDPAAPYNVTPQKRAIALPADCKGQLALVYCFGLGGSALSAWNPVNGPNRYLFFHQLARAGIPIITHDMTYPRTAPGGPTDQVGRPWGNKTYRDIVESIRTTLCPSLGLRSDKILMMGSSAGSSNMLVYAQEHPDRIAGLIMLMPGTAIEPIRIAEVADGLADGFTEATDTGAKNTVNLAWAKPYVSIGQRDTNGSHTGHVGWYYGTSINYEAGSPRAGEPIDPSDPRNTDVIATIVDDGWPVHYYYSTGDNIVTYTDAAGVNHAPGAEEWCPAVGIEAQIVSTTDNHDGSPQPPGRPDDAQWQDFPVEEIATALLDANNN